MITPALNIPQASPIAICADCLDVFPLIPDTSIDMVLCDLPYCITCNSWDSPIPLEDFIVVAGRKITFSVLQQALWNPNKKLAKTPEVKELLSLPMREVVKHWKENKQPGLWTHYKRVIKPHGAIVLFGAGMFSAELMATGKDLWHYNLVWEKNQPTSFMNANRMPMRSHEDMLVFYKHLPVYHPQKTTGHPRKVSTAHHKRNCVKTTNYGDHKAMTYDSTERYPKSVWKFPTDKQKSALHPTQKPVALCEELIKTFTEDGALVLDNSAGSFTTAVACDNLNRRWIAIEKEQNYVDIGLNRVNENRNRLGLESVTQTDFNN